MIYDPSRTWDISETNITLTTDNGYFLYLKFPVAEGITTAEIFASEDHIDPLRDEGYVICKKGYIAPPQNGVRQISLILGNSASSSVKPSKVDFTNSDAPALADFTPYLKHGHYPDITLWQIKDDGVECKLPSLPDITRTGGNITSVSFGQLPEQINGFILIK